MANERYWIFAKEIIDLWMHYQTTKKLFVNFTHDETKHMVEHVVNKYYGGDAARVQDAEKMFEKRLNAKLARFEVFCQNLGVKPLTKDWLYHHIRDGKAAAKYRKKISAALKKDAPPEHL